MQTKKVTEEPVSEKKKTEPVSGKKVISSPKGNLKSKKTLF
jgi:hypothetical protein